MTTFTGGNKGPAKQQVSLDLRDEGEQRGPSKRWRCSWICCSWVRRSLDGQRVYLMG